MTMAVPLRRFCWAFVPFLLSSVHGFLNPSRFPVTKYDEQRTTYPLCAAANSDMDESPPLPPPVVVLDCTLPTENDAVERLKRNLFQLAASYDRGFGASPRARENVMSIIEELEQANPQSAAGRGANGNSSGDDNDQVPSPLRGNWRMIWTNAADVLVLASNPFLAVGAIYQEIDPPFVTNVIDFQPRVQALVPPNLIRNSLFRARVQTRSSERRGFPNRVGLVFESVQFQPLQVWGMDIDVFPPLGFDLPQIGGITSNPDGPGYFDVTYLDEELLVIRQYGPGLFALVKVDSIDP